MVFRVRGKGLGGVTDRSKVISILRDLPSFENQNIFIPRLISPVVISRSYKEMFKFHIASNVITSRSAATILEHAKCTMSDRNLC